MDASKLNKVLTVIFIGLFAIGCYHASTFVVKNNEVMISIYHIAYNIMILSLMLFIFLEIRDVVRFKVHSRILAISSIYFFWKILINAAYFFNPFVKLIEKHDPHIWSLGLTLLVLVSLVVIKYLKI